MYQSTRWIFLSVSCCLTSDSRREGKDQSSDGYESHRSRAAGILNGRAFLILYRSDFFVDERRVRLSASLAEVVDILGKCCTVTQHPKNAEIMCTDWIMIDADSSFVTFLESQPKTTASLSVNSRISLPISFSGQQKNGRAMAMASSVGDLHP